MAKRKKTNNTMAKRKKSNNDLQNIKQKAKDRATRTPLKSGANSCSPKRSAVPAPYHLALVVLFQLDTRCQVMNEERTDCSVYFVYWFIVYYWEFGNFNILEFWVFIKVILKYSTMRYSWFNKLDFLMCLRNKISIKDKAYRIATWTEYATCCPRFCSGN